MQYRPRNDFVILKLTRIEVNKAGVAIPQGSNESMKWTVHSTGPKVEDLVSGDVVLVMGTQGQDLAPLPRERDLFITKEANVLLVVTEDE